MIKDIKGDCEDAIELLLRSMTQNIADVIIRQDATGKIHFVSASVYSVTGYKEEEFLGRSLQDFFTSDSYKTAALAMVNAVNNPSVSVKLEFCIKHASGNILNMEGAVVNMLEKEGVASVIVNFRDVTTGRLSAQKLVASELKFRSLIENSHDGIALMNADSKMIYLSSAIERVMGYPLAELLGTDPRLISHPDDLEPVARILEELYPRPGGTAVAVYRMKHKNGDWRWIKSNITNLLHEEHVGAFVFNYDDITERKNAELLLRESECMMADAQRIARFGNWELDFSDDGFGELRWSDEVFRIYGYEPRSFEVTLDKASEPIHPEDKPLMDKIFEKALTDKSRYFFDHRIVWPDGSMHWVHEDAQFILDEATGKIIKIAGTIQDITERRDTEEKLFKYEANLKTIFDNTEIAYIMLDKQLSMVAFNPRAIKLVNAVYNKTLSIGAPLLNYVNDRVEANRLKVLLKKVLEGNDIKFDFHAKLPDGSEKWYITRINPVATAGEPAHGICIAISDITLRKQHEIEMEKVTKDLIQRNKDLEQFTYVVSHNLRAPLTNIMGLTQLLLDDNQAELMEGGYTKQLLISAQKMDVIIKDLNNILQLRKDVREVKQTIYFSELVQDIKQSLQLVVLQQDISVVTDFDALNEFSTVKSYLYSIFYNLITNSIKYRQPEVPLFIHITSRLNGKSVDLTFRDNGLGIDLRRKGKDVFGLYKRFHHHVEGKGMGLFMVKTQVETLGGSITIESEVNKGTKFTVSFPLH